MEQTGNPSAESTTQSPSAEGDGSGSGTNRFDLANH